MFGLFWSSLITSILVYRASPWHPLAKYPGPLICKLTKYHLAFLSLSGKQYLYYSELHKKYGDVVRIGAPRNHYQYQYPRSSIFSGPNELSICNVDAVTPLMGPNGLEKGPSKLIRLGIYLFICILIRYTTRLVWQNSRR